jgi:hypothetical protein
MNDDRTMDDAKSENEKNDLLIYYANTVPFFPRLHQEALRELRHKVTINSESIKALYRLLFYSSDFYYLFSVEWMEDVMEYDPITRFYLCKTIGLVLGMSDEEQELLLEKYISDNDQVYEIVFKDWYEWQQSYEVLLRNAKTVCLPEPTIDSVYVETIERKRLLQDIQMGISCHLPILLQGNQGMGKTTLIDEIARRCDVHGNLYFIRSRQDSSG